MMKIKNTGNMRIRLDRATYILPSEELIVSGDVGKWAVRTHKDIIDVTPAPYIPKYKQKLISKINIDERGEKE